MNVVTRAGSWLDSLSNETHNRQDMEVANLASFVEENQPQAVSKEKVTDSNVAGESDDNVVGVSDVSEGPVDLGCPLPVDISEASVLRVAAHRLRNFLLMVAMHDYYYCILTGASPLQHKDKVPAEGAAH